MRPLSIRARLTLWYTGVVVAILLQQGRAGDIASAFGGSTSQTVFGARAGATMLTRATTVLAVLFMLGSIGLAIAWQNAPFVILVVYAGLQSIPEEPLEAAMVDGATRTQTLTHVIFPFLRPLVLFVLIIRSMDAFRIFDQVFVMTGGGPGTTTQTITFYNYVMAFRMLRMEIGRAHV